MGLIDQLMANLYKPPKQEKPNTVLPKNLTPQKVANMMNQTAVSQGQLLRGQVLDLRANQILVLLENGATVSARTEGTLELSIGQNAKFLVSQTTDDQIILKLHKEEADAENPMIDKALNAANIQKTERSVSIVTELLAHQQPVNEAGIRHYLSLSAKYPELPVKSLVLMELHHIPVTKENVEQFNAYQDRNAKLLTQTQDMLNNLTETINQMPEGPARQEVIRELQQMLGREVTSDAASANTAPSFGAANLVAEQIPEQAWAGHNPATQTLAQAADTSTALSNEGQGQENSGPVQAVVSEVESGITPFDAEQTLSNNTATGTVVNNITKSTADSPNTALDTTHIPSDNRTNAEPLIQSFLDSFLLQPEDVADPEKVQKYYDELNEKLEKLDQLSQKVSEQAAENNGFNAPKQMRQNLSFIEAVNNVFPYIQLPLKFKETPAHGELYVYEKKKALKPSDSLSALLHLELEALGTTDIFVTLSGNHVTTRFSMTDKESAELIRTEMPKLVQALSAKGYVLQSEVAVREPSEENTPTLLEQFLEEHAPGGLNRYTFDIRA